MDLGKKALYTSLRLSFQENPRLAVEKWQVEDLSQISPDELFSRFGAFEVTQAADRTSFQLLADSFETPEEMADALSEDLSSEEGDQLYLLVFELWRRFLSERKTLTLFADELDRQIALFDAGKIVDFSAFQDSLQNLLMIFQDSDESGLPPAEFMTRFSSLMAHNLEEFLYDFLSEQIEAGHENYVRDFVDVLYPFIEEKKWFDLLSFEASPPAEGEEFQEAVRGLVKKQKQFDIDFFFDLAAFLARRGDFTTYSLVAKKILPHIEMEEDLIDFLELSSDFFRLSDDEEKESAIEKLLIARKAPPSTPLSSKDPIRKSLEALLSL